LKGNDLYLENKKRIKEWGNYDMFIVKKSVYEENKTN
jgi:hypothetical protein